MDAYQDSSLGCASEAMRILTETYKHIDSFKHMSTPGNSKMTVYSELVELKNTLDALKTALLKLISHLQRTIPNIVIQAIANVLIDVLNTLLSVDHTITADTWSATLLRVYQLDFLLAFQCHQLQEICLEHYHQPTALLCTNSSKDFWETYFTHQWFVPWPQFWERVLQRGWAEPSEEKVIRHFLDFCADSYVSPYELCLFLKWFGQLELAFKNLIMTLKSGLLVGAIPASEANNLLKGKMSGSFLVRFSKTRPGCFAVTVGGDTSSPRHFLLNYLEPGKFSMQHSETVYNSIHNFVQMQPRLKYPVTTRLINELMADVPTLRASVEIHTPGMGRASDMRNSAGGSLVTSSTRAAPSSISNGAGGGGGFGKGPMGLGLANGHAQSAIQNRPNDSRAIYDPESANIGSNMSGMRTSNGFGSNAPNTETGSSRSQVPMGFGAPPSSSHMSMPPSANPIAINTSTRSSESGSASPEISPSPTSFSTGAPMGFGAPRSSISPSFGFALPSNATSSAVRSVSPIPFAAFQGTAGPHSQNSVSAVPPSSSAAGAGLGNSASASPVGFGPPRPASASAPNAPAGFAPIQRQPLGFGPSTSGPSQPQQGAPQFNIAQTLIPQSMVPSQSGQHHPIGFSSSSNPNYPNSTQNMELHSSSNSQGSRSPLSQSPSERNAMFFPGMSSASGLQPSNHGYRLVPHHQQQPAGQTFDQSQQGATNAFQGQGSSLSQQNSRQSSAHPPALKRSVSQQQHRMGDGGLGPSGTALLRPAFVRRSTSSQLSRNQVRSGAQSQTNDSAVIPEEGIDSSDGGPDLFDLDDLRAAAPLDICVICLDRDRSTVFLECSHMVCCTECSGLVSTCPICRQVISRVIPVYRS